MEKKAIIKTKFPQSCLKLDQDQKFYDVILQINDKQLYCHRFVLATFSPFFDAMFTNDMKESKQQLIELKEIYTQVSLFKKISSLSSHITAFHIFD